MTLKLVLFSVFSLLIMNCCTYELENTVPPENLIPPDSFELILEDMMLLESYVKTQQNNVAEFYPSMIKSADPIFEKYNVDSIRYINSMEYYAQKQEVLLKMYENIQDRIQIDAAELEEE
ncbi:MAG: DUF4296 domain-containing protein [Brumimicrobium sp.]